MSVPSIRVLFRVTFMTRWITKLSSWSRRASRLCHQRPCQMTYLGVSELAPCEIWEVSSVIMMAAKRGWACSMKELSHSMRFLLKCDQAWLWEVAWEPFSFPTTCLSKSLRPRHPTCLIGRHTTRIVWYRGNQYVSFA